jgi:[protein-PII] uridylyltransferase
LLYEIASALENSGVDIQLSKIDSVGTQVVDTFYVEELSGGALSPERAQEVKTSLERVIGKRSE